MPAKKPTKKVASKKPAVKAPPAKKAAAAKPLAKKAVKKVAKKAASKTPSKKTLPKKPPLSVDAVAKAAYLNYRRRTEQGMPGNHDSDWLEAERSLKNG